MPFSRGDRLVSPGVGAYLDLESFADPVAQRSRERGGRSSDHPRAVRIKSFLGIRIRAPDGMRARPSQHPCRAAADGFELPKATQNWRQSCRE